MHDISAKNFKNFFKWTKIQLQISKSGVFWEKNCFANFFETSVKISLYNSDSRYFSKKFQELLNGKKSNFKLQNRG